LGRQGHKKLTAGRD